LGGGGPNGCVACVPAAGLGVMPRLSANDRAPASRAAVDAVRADRAATQMS